MTTKGNGGAGGGKKKADGNDGRRKTAKQKVATPWGPSTVVDEVKIAQQAGEKRFATVVQLLESRAGEALVRIAYTNDGIARRGPVTLRRRDVERLNAVLDSRPMLADALRRGGDVAG